MRAERLMRSVVVVPTAVLLAAASAAAAAAAPAKPKFTKAPTAAKAGGKVKIEFAVSAPTDVAVFIEDGKGKTVRHLVAGVLGENPPAPLQADSLAQMVEWDGKFDKSIVAAGLKPAGPFKARVAIGTRPSFDGYLLHNRAATGRIATLLGRLHHRPLRERRIKRSLHAGDSSLSSTYLIYYNVPRATLPSLLSYICA